MYTATIHTVPIVSPGVTIEEHVARDGSRPAQIENIKRQSLFIL